MTKNVSPVTSSNKAQHTDVALDKRNTEPKKAEELPPTNPMRAFKLKSVRKLFWENVSTYTATLLLLLLSLWILLFAGNKADTFLQALSVFESENFGPQTLGASCIASFIINGLFLKQRSKQKLIFTNTLRENLLGITTGFGIIVFAFWLTAPLTREFPFLPLLLCGLLYLTHKLANHFHIKYKAFHDRSFAGMFFICALLVLVICFFKFMDFS